MGYRLEGCVGEEFNPYCGNVGPKTSRGGLSGDFESVQGSAEGETSNASGLSRIQVLMRMACPAPK
jgi:hypothetical protein